jgi:autotransporter-associated beta strand protein
VVLVLAAAILGLAVGPAGAAITIISMQKGFADSTKTQIATTHLGTTLVSYDATGVDKLVIAIATESGFNGQTCDVTGLTFNGVAMTQIVQANTRVGSGDVGTAEIWYLDNPLQGAGTFTFSYTSSGGGINGAFVSIIGLAGTADGSAGIGDTDAQNFNLGPITSSITTFSNNSLVIAMVENSGNNNASGTPTVNAPLTLINNGLWGSNWGGSASGYQFVSDIGTTITPTFTTNTGPAYTIHTAAVEFQAAVPTLFWDIDGATPGAGGSAPAGVWNATDPNWNTDHTGGAGGSVGAWSAGYTARFGAGTNATGAYTVTVDGTQAITGLAFEEGTVTLAPAETGGALRLDGNSVMNVASGKTATVQVPISEDGAGTTPRKLYKVGDGTLVLSGALSHTGATTVITGTLVLSGNNVAAIGGMALNGGVTQFESPASINGTARDVTVNSGGTAAFGAAFGDANIPAALSTRIAAGSAGVIAADNYAGTNFDFNAAGLTAASLGAVGAVNYTGTLTSNAGVYRLGGGGGTLNMANENAVTGTGASLVVCGGGTGGTVVLPVANDYDGTTTVSAGTLVIGNGNSLGTTAGGTAVASGATLALQGGIAVGAEALSINGAGISSGGALRSISGSNTYGGPITLAGASRINSDSGTLTLDVDSGSAIAGTNTALTFGGAGNITVADPIATGSGTLTKDGAGTLTLAGNNTYTGLTTISAGTLTLSGDNTSATGGVTLTAGALNVNSPKALGTGTVILTAGILDNTSGSAKTLATNNAVTLNGNLAFSTSSGTAANNLTFGAGAVTNGGSRTLTLNGTGTTLAFGGVMTNTANAVQTTTVNGAGNTLVLGGYALSNNATSRIDVISGTANVTITGPVTDGGTATASGLTYSGTGTLTLAGTNTYKGATAVNTGTVLVNGDSSAATGTVTVAAAGRLGGGGIIGGAVVVSGKLAPGDGAGTLTIGTPAAPKTLTLAASSTYEWQLGASAADKVVVTGELVLPAAWTLKLFDAGGTLGSSYDLFTFASLSPATLTPPTIDYGTTGWSGAAVALVGNRVVLQFEVPGDTNGDFVVDAADFITLKKNFGAGEGGGAAVGNFDKTGKVDWADLGILMSNMGPAAGAPATPEPATLGLLMVGVLAMLRRRRK